MPEDVGDHDVVFVFAMALANGSPVPQPSGQFDLLIDGQRELSFRVAKYLDHWRGPNAHFVFHPRRVEAASPGQVLYLDDRMTLESFAAFGLGFLRVARGRWLRCRAQDPHCPRSPSALTRTAVSHGILLGSPVLPTVSRTVALARPTLLRALALVA